MPSLMCGTKTWLPICVPTTPSTTEPRLPAPFMWKCSA
jgi:hypothetical protein